MDISEQTVSLECKEVNNAEQSQYALLGICASMKPAPGIVGKSAAREFLTQAIGIVAETHSDRRIGLLCMREHPLPFFDGRLPEAVPNNSISSVLKALERSNSLLVSVPCYWGAVSGVFKNFIDVTCGPAYEMGAAWRTVFHGKKVGLFIVGADENSAQQGTAQAQQIFQSVGAKVVGAPVVLVNPRKSTGSAREILKGITSLSESLLS